MMRYERARIKMEGVEMGKSGSDIHFTPTEFINTVNQTLDYAYASVMIEGEVASFKVNQGKWVFFDVKDEESVVNCFMALWDLKTPLEDGMKVVVRGVPKITKWGKFSFTVRAVQPVGEGSIKKAYELLKNKLAKEGLFEQSRKRPLPKPLTRLGIISSTQAAGYADFIKIINARWGGLKIQVAHTQVQGMDAPEQIVRALNYFNERNEVQVIAIIRGGGSADDLACFNDEALVKAVAVSKIPVATGIGHEVDESLCDLVADFRASTPSNLAELITPEKSTVKAEIKAEVEKIHILMLRRIDEGIVGIRDMVGRIYQEFCTKCDDAIRDIERKKSILNALNPEETLRRGYAIIDGEITPGNVVKITTLKQNIKAEIKEANERKTNSK